MATFFSGCSGSSLVLCFWCCFFSLVAAEFCFLKGAGFETGIAREEDEEWWGREGFGGGPRCHREWR
ncbi:hypothetical protein BT93_F2642 [Corymbia citriodora subsp. variegata]|nr:hypothetical protein BT93_F2642 [Corymbia citriodora subsp. variegata]